jgi:hypothetical protein
MRRTATTVRLLDGRAFTAVRLSVVRCWGSFPPPPTPPAAILILGHKLLWLPILRQQCSSSIVKQ